MSDDLIFREVDEDVRREQLEQVWKRYGKFAIAGGVLIIAITAAGVLWQNYQTELREADGARFEQASQMQGNDPAAAAEVFSSLVADGNGGYPALAALREAEARVAADDKAGGLDAYQRLIANSAIEQNFRDVAALKAALLAEDMGKHDTAEALLSPLATGNSTLKHAAIEALAGVQLGAGKRDAAIASLKQLTDDALAPAGAKARAGEILRVLGAE